MADLYQLASSYERAANDADRVIVLQMRPLLEQLRAYARRIAHRRSGRLGSGLAIDGPVRKSGGVEGAIVANVVYADSEVARGGLHDYAGRTLEEQAGLIQQWADGIGVEIVKQIGGV